MMWKPKELFLIDAIGAMISSSIFGIVIIFFPDLFGIPLKGLFVLAIIPLFFVLFDCYCYINIEKVNKGLCLRIIALLNLGYCFLSILFILIHSESLTSYGIVYFFSELSIVLGLVFLELRISKFR